MQGNPGLPMAERGGQITVEKSGAIKDLPFDLKTMTLVGDRIRFGDIVTHVEGKEITDHASYAKIVEKAVGGDQLQLTILRSGKASSVYVPTSSTHPPIAQQYPVSYRRTGFPQVIRHDAVVDRNLCGGPVIDTAGRVVGINIARADIHQMLAIPSTTIQKLLEQLRAETKSQHE
jgi:S1-C subfamily serine protease